MGGSVPTINSVPSQSPFNYIVFLLLQSHDCLRTGPPEVGELIVVSTAEGQVVNASFVRQHTHKFYQVRKNTIGC